MPDESKPKYRGGENYIKRHLRIGASVIVRYSQDRSPVYGWIVKIGAAGRWGITTKPNGKRVEFWIDNEEQISPRKGQE